MNLLTPFAASEVEKRVLEDRGDEIVGYAIATLLDTFSRRRAIKRIEDFGLSRATSVAVLTFIEEYPETRSDLARRLAGRARISGFGCAVAIGLAFVPAIPKIYIGVIAVGGVYCVFSLLAWMRYSKLITR